MKNKILGGRYRIQDRIGEGGMAFVYLALDEKLGRRVAIKVLHEHMEKNEDIRKRFQMEAQAISSLDHPNIVKIYDFSGDESERLWIVTEVIRGQNLAQLIQKQSDQSLHPVPAACIVREICKALHKAHTTGIVHRDIKPENVMITNEGRVKLMDFGIAKDMQKSNLTLTGTFMGSPSYMSPEQIRGKDVDNRSDIYSLGVLFYEIVSGKLPYTGQTTHDVVMRIMEGEFTYPRFLIPTLAPEVDTAIVRAMQKDATRRFQSISEFGEAIDSFLTTYGHVESHVELERYFKDRPGYEERLKKSAALGAQDGPISVPGHPSRNSTAHRMGNSSMIRGGRTNVHNATTRDRASHGPASKQPIAHTGNSAAATAHFPTHRNSQIMRSEHKEPAHKPAIQTADAATEYFPVPRVRTNQSQQQQQPQYRSEHVEQRPVKSGRTLPPRAFPHVKRTAGGPARNAAAIAKVEDARKHVRPRIPRRSMIRYNAIPREQYNATPAPHQYLIGFFLVGIIVGLTLWGFWELQSRISDQPGRAPKNVERAYKLENQKQSNANKRSPKIDTEEGTSNGYNPKAVNTVEAAPTRKPIANSQAAQTSQPKPPKTVRTQSPKNAESTGRKKIEKAAHHHEQQSINTSPSPVKKPAIAVVLPTEANAKPNPKKAPSSPISNNKAEFAVSSQPAAEIWIDGKKMGTTVDQTSGSGWITLSVGNHSLELRRSGYETWSEKFSLEGGEKKKIQTIELEKLTNSSATPESYSLTITVRPIPAQVNVRNLESGRTESFTLNEESRTLALPAGTYQVKVEKNGEIKERKLDLTGSTKSLTFGVEFKETQD